jgi:hypothetical protein
MLIRILTQVLHSLENNFFFYIFFIHSIASLHCFIFLVSFIGVIILNILDRNFLEKSTALLYIWLKWIWIQICQNDADPTGRSGFGNHNTAIQIEQNGQNKLQQPLTRPLFTIVSVRSELNLV